MLCARFARLKYDTYMYMYLGSIFPILWHDIIVVQSDNFARGLESGFYHMHTVYGRINYI